MTRMTYSQNDYSGESTVLTVSVSDINAANFDAQETLHAALETAIELVVIGAKVKRQKIIEDLGAGGFAADTEAQREMKWLISYHDNSFPARKLSVEMGCADTIDPDLLVANSDMAELSDADWVSFITAFEAVVVAPYTANAVTIDRITLVGRNL
ncbi:MAG: hypothetical protein KAT00_01905 [Planctomycetes bacterium]|nr:hypothetical protein [Planctomycetota bacterium]